MTTNTAPLTAEKITALFREIKTIYYILSEWLPKEDEITGEAVIFFINTPKRFAWSVGPEKYLLIHPDNLEMFRDKLEKEGYILKEITRP